MATTPKKHRRLYLSYGKTTRMTVQVVAEYMRFLRMASPHQFGRNNGQRNKYQRNHLSALVVGRGKMPDSDEFTKLLRISTKYLLSQQPGRVAIGILIGLVMEAARQAVVQASPPFLNDYLILVRAIPSAWPFISLGILIAFIPMIFKKNKVTAQDTLAVQIVEELVERGELSKVDRKFAYRSLLRAYVRAFNPESDIDNQIKLQEILNDPMSRETDPQQRSKKA